MIDRHTSIGKLVAERPDRSRLFERLHIDYCCRGNLELDEACAAVAIDVEEVLAQLIAHDAGQSDTSHPNPADLTMSELADHIEATHHIYLRAELPRLETMADKVANVHGDAFPWLHELRKVFAHLVAELEMHMTKEEEILFPMVRTLEEAQSRPTFHCGSVENPIAVMEREHDNAGAALQRLRELSGGFEAPQGACNTFRALLTGLAELEADLHQHIHEENNILFVRASDAERALSAA